LLHLPLAAPPRTTSYSDNGPWVISRSWIRGRRGASCRKSLVAGGNGNNALQGLAAKKCANKARLFVMLIRNGLTLVCGLLAATAIAACTTSSIPKHMSTNQPRPSGNQTMNFLQRFVPESEASSTRLRVQLIASLTPAHRAAVGEAIGRYAISDAQDKNALTNDIDRILSATEREHVVAAHSAWAAEQYVLFAKIMAEAARESPESSQQQLLAQQLSVPPPIHAPPISGFHRSPDAGVIVANWLPTLGIEPNGFALVAKPLDPFSPLSAFLYSGSQTRARVRGAMLGALTPAHREAVGRVLGQSAVSSIRDDAILSKQLDDVLTAHEKRQILESFAEFVSEERSEEPGAGVAIPAAARGDRAPNAGAVLWRALLLEPNGGGFVTQ
jgi:hypothetical protein